MLNRSMRNPIPIVSRDFHRGVVSPLGTIADKAKVDTRDRKSIKRVIKNLRNQAKQEDKKVISKVIRNEYSGEGVRKTKAYETKLTKEEYDEVRTRFWASRVQEKESIWKILHTICESDYRKFFPTLATALNTIRDFGLTLYRDNVTVCFGTFGEVYCLPVFVVNRPRRYNALVEAVPKEEMLKVLCDSKG